MLRDDFYLSPRHFCCYHSIFRLIREAVKINKKVNIFTFQETCPSWSIYSGKVWKALFGTGKDVFVRFFPASVCGVFVSSREKFAGFVIRNPSQGSAGPKNGPFLIKNTFHLLNHASWVYMTFFGWLAINCIMIILYTYENTLISSQAFSFFFSPYCLKRHKNLIFYVYQIISRLGEGQFVIVQILTFLKKFCDVRFSVIRSFKICSIT